MQSVPKKYNPQTAEPRLQQFWSENQIFAFAQENGRPVYAVDTPPATVSGDLHLGHCLLVQPGRVYGPLLAYAGLRCLLSDGLR